MIGSVISTPIRRLVAFNTLSQLAGRIFSTISTFIVSLMLIRHFGLESYGDFIKITAFVTPFFLVADFGLNAVFLQLFENKSVTSELTYWYSLLILRLILSAILIVIVVIITYLLPMSTTDGYTPIVRLGILIFVPTILLQSIIKTTNAVFQKNLRYSDSAIAISIGSIVTLLSAVIITSVPPRNDSAILAALTVIFGTLANAVAAWILVKKYKTTGNNVTIDFTTVFELFKKSIPLGITLLFNLIYFRIDTIILTIHRPTSEVGIYGFIYKFFEATLVFPTFFVNSIYPMLVSRYSDSKHRDDLRPLVLRSVFVLGAMSILMVALLNISSGLLPIIKEDLKPGIGALRILSLGIPIFYLSGLSMWLLIVFKQRWPLLCVYGVSMIANIVLNIMYIPKYGMYAASWITVTCEFMVLLFSIIILLKFFITKPA